MRSHTAKGVVATAAGFLVLVVVAGVAGFFIISEINATTETADTAGIVRDLETLKRRESQ